jgi:hypothetical protein
LYLVTYSEGLTLDVSADDRKIGAELQVSAKGTAAFEDRSRIVGR